MAGVLLAGAVAYQQLPVSALPQVDYPTIQVVTLYPGASPEVTTSSITAPLERQFGQMPGLKQMSSTSSGGASVITLQFDLDLALDIAEQEVQAAINASGSFLPADLPNPPIYNKVNPADTPIMTQGQMYDAGSTIIAQKLSQLQGVGQVQVGGSSLPAVRVELNPQTLNKYRIAFEDVRTVLAATNANRPKGSLEEGDKHWQIYANDQAKKAFEYLPLIVAYRNGSAVKLTDLGTVVDSVQDLRNAGSSNGKPSVLIIISRQPNANIIETVDNITALLPLLRASIPSAIKVDVVMRCWRR